MRAAYDRDREHVSRTGIYLSFYIVIQLQKATGFKTHRERHERTNRLETDREKVGGGGGGSAACFTARACTLLSSSKTDDK